MVPAADLELPKLKIKSSKKSKTAKSTSKFIGHLDTPSRIPLFYVDMDVVEGTVVLPIKLPLLVSEELISLSTKKKLNLEHVWITAITNALSTLAYSQGLGLPELMTCGWWRDLRTPRPNALKSPLGKWTGYNAIKIKAHSEPVQPDVFWAEVRTTGEKIKRCAKPWGMLHEATEQLSAIERHGIDGYNPDSYQAHVMLSYVQSEQGGATSNDSIQVEEYMCVRSMSDYSFAPLHISVTDVRANKMSCVLIYNRKWISREFALTYIENIRALLDFVVRLHCILPAQRSAIIDMPLY